MKPWRKFGSPAFLVPAAFFIAYAVFNIQVFIEPGLEDGDLASYSLQIIRAGSFSESLGPYSRFNFNHPGPIWFYYQAFMEIPLFFLPTPYGRHLAAQFLLNILFVFLALRLLRTSVKRDGLVLLFFIILLFCLYPRGRNIFLHPWPPSMLIFPTMTLTLAAVRISCGELNHLWVAALSAVFIVQNNISGLAVVVPFMFLAVVLYTRNLKKGSPSRQRGLTKNSLLRDLRLNRGVILLSLAFVVIAFLPPVYEQISSEKGNVSKIIDHFRAQGGVQHSLPEAAVYIAGFYKDPLGNRVPISPIVVLLFLAALSLLNFFQTDAFMPYLVLFAFAGVVFSTAGAMTVPRTLLEYVFRYETAFAGILYFAALSPFIRKIKPPRPAGKVLLFLLVLAVVPAIRAFYAFRPLPPDPKFDRLFQAIQPVKGETVEFFFRRGGPHHNQWGVAARLALRMVREGYQVRVPEEWDVVFGRKLTRLKDPAEARRITLYATENYSTPVREHSFSAGGTTIEFGRLIPFSVPAEIRFDSPDEYFVGWTTAGTERRGAERSSATILVPLGPVEPDAAFLLKISLQSPEQKSTRISINGKFLAEEHFPPSQMVEKTYLCSPGFFRGSEENSLEFRDAGFFKSLTLLPAGSGNGP